jgi:hypothetical protein
MLNDARGRSIQPLLCAGKTTVPEKFADLENLKTFWSSDEENLLLQKVETMGKKWTEISRFFHNRTPLEVKNRYYILIRKTFLKSPQKDLPSILSMDISMSIFQTVDEFLTTLSEN